MQTNTRNNPKIFTEVKQPSVFKPPNAHDTNQTESVQISSDEDDDFISVDANPQNDNQELVFRFNELSFEQKKMLQYVRRNAAHLKHIMRIDHPELMHNEKITLPELKKTLKEWRLKIKKGKFSDELISS